MVHIALGILIELFTIATSYYSIENLVLSTIMSSKSSNVLFEHLKLEGSLISTLTTNVL